MGYYVRRGQKIIGPLDSAQLKEYAAAGKLLPTDQIARDVTGPWKAAGKTSLFDAAETPEEESPQPPAVVPKRQSLAVSSRGTSLPTEVEQSVISSISASIRGMYVSVSGWMSTRTQRKHELKLAEMQARQAKQTRESSPSSPIMSQTIVVKNVNKSGGCGCSGCSLLLPIILSLIVGLVIFANNQ